MHWAMPAALPSRRNEAQLSKSTGETKDKNDQ